MHVNINEIVEAMDSIDDEEICLYDPEKNTIIYEQLEDDNNYIPLPDKYEINEYQGMVDFSNRIDDPTIREWLNNSLHGKGAFRRFRATLERFGITHDWYDYREYRLKQIAMQWCEDHGLMYDTDTPLQIDDEDEQEDYEIIDEPIKPVSLPLRLVKLDQRNYMSALAVCDAYLQQINVISHSDYVYAQAYLEDLISKYDVYVMSQQGRFVAMVSCKYDEGYVIKDLIVLQSERRKGIGTQLIQEIQNLDEIPLRFEVPVNHQVMHAFLQAIGYATTIYMTYTK